MSQQGITKRLVGKHACESCRKSKTRCIIDTLDQHRKCRKCLEHATPCEWKEISQTRTRRRTDTRVAILEDQLRSITAKLLDIDSRSDSTRSEVDAPASEWRGNNNEANLRHEEPVQFVTTTSPFDLPQADMQTYEAHPAMAIVPPARNLNTVLPMYTMEEKKRAGLLSTFASKLHPLYPMTGLAAGRLSQLEQQRSYTLNSMIVAACILDEPMIFKDMHDTNIRILAHLAIVSGEKSLDLVQAFLVTAAWADSPDDIARLNIFQWTHLAYSMAVEIGLIGKSSRRNRSQDLAQMAQNASVGKKERLWTLLAVCLSSSRVDISFRRQSRISLDLLVKDALALFEPQARSADDRRFVAWLRLQLIAEEVENMKQKLETRKTHNSAGISEADFSWLDGKLQKWEDDHRPSAINVSLEIELGFCRSKLHELAAHFDEGAHHFEMSSLATRSDGPMSDSEIAVKLNPLYVRTILAFVADCHSILESLIGAGKDTLRALPLLAGLRGPYAFKALAMLERRADNPKDKMSQIVDSDTIRWPYYARTVSRLLEEASANGLFVAPTVALRIRNRAVTQERLRREIHGTERPHAEQRAVNMPGSAENHFNYDSLVYEWPDFDISSAVWDLFPMDEGDFQLPLTTAETTRTLND